MSEDTKPSAKGGELALSLLFGQLGLSVKPEDLRQRLGKVDDFSLADARFVAETHYSLKGKITQLGKRGRGYEKRLKTAKVPAIGQGEFGLCIYLGASDEGFQLIHPETNQVTTADLNQAEELLGPSLLSLRDLGKVEHDEFSLFWIVKQILSRRFAFMQVVMSSIFIQIFAIVTPLFTMVIIDKIFSATANAQSTLQVLLIALVAVAVFDFLIGLSRKLLLNHVMNQVDITLMTRFFRKLTYLPMAHYAGKSTGDTISRTKDVEGIRSFISSSALASFIDMPFGLVFLGVMALFSVQLTVIVAISIILTFLLYGVIGPFLKEKVKQQQEMAGDSQSFMIEAITSMETVKSMSAENRFQRQWEEQIDKQSSFSHSTDMMTSVVGQMGQLINKVTLALTLLIGATLVIAGDMTAGQLIAFNMLVGRVSAPAHRIASMLQGTQQFFSSINRVKELYNAQPEPAYLERRSSLPDMMGVLEFDHVNFKYADDGPATLENISFKLDSGEVVGIVGSSGSGKSTLVRLIQRLAAPTSGTITIDGVNIAQVDPVWLRTQIGCVLQDNLLFDRSIAENITVANPTATQAEIERVCQLAGAEDFIKLLPQAYDTPVGERGELLSTGQRQRIAIARALITDPKILIFDEATASLDYEAEKLFQDNLNEMTKGRTVIIVAHRLSTLRIADRILTLEQGKLIENGAPADLLRKKGRFAQLFALHSGRAPSSKPDPNKNKSDSIGHSADNKEAAA